jgi:hypothetical protein
MDQFLLQVKNIDLLEKPIVEARAGPECKSREE